MKVLIMGLGLHGGGLESARYLLKHGAILTITDLRDEKTLFPSIAQLERVKKSSGDGSFVADTAPVYSSIRFVLGRHEIEDFKNADMVIKNPGVPPDSPFLQAARCVETDISLFLASNPARLTAVTGSKGKSTTASAIHWVLKYLSPRREGAKESGMSANNASPSAPLRLGERELRNNAYLGGNITVSPLTFLDDLQEGDDVVLELSSWQLGDLRGRQILKPQAAVLTAIMPDHLDRYHTMEEYVADKRVIYQGQDSGDYTIAGDDDWGRSFLAESKAQALVYSHAPLPAGVSGGWIDGAEGPGYARLNGGELINLVPDQPLIPGRHHKQNLLAAGLALLSLGLPPELIRKGLATFPGVEHRLELFYQAGGIDFYNDSAATIPEAAAAAIEALGNDGRLVLLTGGADKNLDFTPLAQAARRAKALILLAGAGSDKLAALLNDAGIPYRGPFDNLDKAAAAALEAAAPGDRIALSPGCASFGMFLNEFDRGHKWKETIKRLT